MSVQKTLKASEVVAILQEGIASHGDVPVYLDDPDTGWLLGVTLKFKETSPRYESPSFRIDASYYADEE